MIALDDREKAIQTQTQHCLRLLKDENNLVFSPMNFIKRGYQPKTFFLTEETFGIQEVRIPYHGLFSEKDHLSLDAQERRCCALNLGGR